MSYMNDTNYRFDSAADARHVAHMDRQIQILQEKGLRDRFNFPTIKALMARIRF